MNPFAPGEKIALYLRDSGGDEQELSVHQQRAEASAWAHAHQLQVTRVFVDEAMPGSSTVGREQFRAMLAHFHNTPQEAGVVIWKFSRFARSFNDSQFYRADLRRRGYIVHSLKDQIPAGIDGRFFEAAIDWMNERFLKDLSEDVQRGLRYNLLEYGAVPGKVPRGFMAQPVHIGKRRDGAPRIVHRWVPDPQQKEQVRRAFEMRANGASYAEIIAETGLYKSKNSLTTFFPNKIYKGVLEYSGMVLEDYCAPIVSAELWEAAQRVGRRRRNTATQPNAENPRRVSSDYLLSGLAYCQECGAPLNAHTIGGAKRYQYYACSRRKRRGDCKAKHIPRHALESAVIEKLERTALSLENLLMLQTKIRAQHKQEHASDAHNAEERTQRLEAIKKELANIDAAVRAGGYTRTMTESLRALEAEQDKLRDAQARAALEPTPAEYPPAKLAELAAEMKESLNSENPDERRLALRSLLTRVVVRRDEKQLVGILYYMPRDFLYLRVVPPRGSQAQAIKISVPL